MVEEWRTVIHDGEIFENYEVSNMGRVRNKTTGRILKGSLTRKGYVRVKLYDGENHKDLQVHRLVGFAFIENDDVENKTIINHKNEIKNDNRVENLEWCTVAYNNEYGTRIERCKETRAKNRKPKRERIKKRLPVRCVETGVVYESCHDVEQQTGLANGSICKCCNGKQKTCGKCHWEWVA